MAASAPGQLLADEASEASEAIKQPKPKADACILLWMGGDMAALETFDPKQYHSFEVGTPLEKIISTFPAIDTAVDNINIGQRIEGNGESEELKSFTTGGLLGSEYGPFNLPFPEQASQAVRPPKGNDWRSVENAHRLLGSKDKAAFDLRAEPKESFDKYNTGRFGRGCLLARRLVESDARFVEVTTEYIPFVHWHTHEKGHTTVDRLHKEIDGPIAQLILDLESRGLLDRTLVVIASELSRDGYSSENGIQDRAATVLCYQRWCRQGS